MIEVNVTKVQNKSVQNTLRWSDWIVIDKSPSFQLNVFFFLIQTIPVRSSLYFEPYSIALNLRYHEFEPRVSMGKPQIQILTPTRK